jgi:dTDP-4-dehydrorhamnose 3,5-epimerase
MKVIATPFEGLFELEPNVFEDARGYFMESFKQSWFDENIAPTTFYTRQRIEV